MGALSALVRGWVDDRRVVRRSKGLGEGAEGDRSAGFGALAAGAVSEVAVLEPVGIAFERDQFGVVDEPVDHRDRGSVVTEDLAPRNCSWHTFAARE